MYQVCWNYVSICSFSVNLLKWHHAADIYNEKRRQRARWCCCVESTESACQQMDLLHGLKKTFTWTASQSPEQSCLQTGHKAEVDSSRWEGEVHVRLSHVMVGYPREFVLLVKVDCILWTKKQKLLLNILSRILIRLTTTCGAPC